MIDQANLLSVLLVTRFLIVVTYAGCPRDQWWRQGSPRQGVIVPRQGG